MTSVLLVDFSLAGLLGAKIGGFGEEIFALLVIHVSHVCGTESALMLVNSPRSPRDDGIPVQLVRTTNLCHLELLESCQGRTSGIR